MKQKKLLALLMAIMAGCMPAAKADGDIFEAWQNTKQKIAVLGLRIKYYTPYVVVPVVSSFVARVTNSPKVGIACGGSYAAYSAFDGMQTIHRIKKKYAVKKQEEGWFSLNDAGRNSFLFARWRQRPDNNGAYYWVTAWQMREDKEQVKRQFLEDLSQNQIMLRDADGSQIVFPKPYQIFAALDQELAGLERDKAALKSLTDVYYAFSQPEAFYPDNSFVRALWPNYNDASHTYIDLDCIMKRLETFKAIIVELGIAENGYSWPITVFQKYGINITRQK